MNTQTESSVVTLETLARRLRLSKRWLHREAAEGRIPSLRAGKRLVFNPRAVEESIARRAAALGPEEGEA